LTARCLADPKFRYYDSVSTDIRRTFARVRREQRERDAAAPPVPPKHGTVITVDRARAAHNAAEAAAKVRPISKRRTA